MTYMYADLDGPLVEQLHRRLGSRGFPGVEVSTTYKPRNPPEEFIWIGLVDGDTTGLAQQVLTYQIRVAADTVERARFIAAVTRSILDSEEDMQYLLDGTTPNPPIYSSVSVFDTTTPKPTALFEGLSKAGYFFSLTMYQVAE